MDPHILSNNYRAFDTFACVFDIQEGKLRGSGPGENSLAKVEKRQDAPVAYGVGLVEQMEVSFLGSNTDDGKHKTCERSEQE